MADYILWSEDLLTKVDKIDEDHKQLIALMNDYLNSAQRGEPEVSKILDDLDMYAKRHFAAEQDSMEQSGYPGLLDHIRQHESLIFSLEKMMKRLLDVGKGVDAELVAMLRGWLCLHIMSHDMKFASYLRENAQQD